MYIIDNKDFASWYLYLHKRAFKMYVHTKRGGGGQTKNKQQSLSCDIMSFVPKLTRR